MPRPQVMQRTQLVPKVFADLGYTTKEYDDHVLTVVYKDEEIAALSQVDLHPDDIVDIIARHFVRTSTPMGAVRG
ncbi:hypothetical protein [Candidatus Magnetobacterium casense]|uniref:Uncharacterized protein n=1 Tax=Candidatus Magnetobacterium casense TaxID=1455061 RepID=A0ABS6S3E6_9BACT|nr:hypothetical protein [Candidatus Magnetobacterium casensis]MBV6343376.1 hypothetical protein [Candidatus Magnetobacterium casensis]